MTAAGLVEATERLYRSLFTAAVAFGATAAGWGLLIAPFNSFNDHPERSLALGVGTRRHHLLPSVVQDSIVRSCCGPGTPGFLS